MPTEAGTQNNLQRLINSCSKTVCLAQDKVSQLTGHVEAMHQEIASLVARKLQLEHKLKEKHNVHTTCTFYYLTYNLLYKQEFSSGNATCVKYRNKMAAYQALSEEQYLPAQQELHQLQEKIKKCKAQSKKGSAMLVQR